MSRMTEENRFKYLHDPIRMQSLPQLQNINIIKSKDTNKEKEKKMIGSSSTNSEIEKADEDQTVDDQLHEDLMWICIPLEIYLYFFYKKIYLCLDTNS